MFRSDVDMDIFCFPRFVRTQHTTGLWFTVFILGSIPMIVTQCDDKNEAVDLWSESSRFSQTSFHRKGATSMELKRIAIARKAAVADAQEKTSKKTDP